MPALQIVDGKFPCPPGIDFSRKARDLVDYYQVSLAVVTRWRRENGILHSCAGERHYDNKKIHAPDDFNPLLSLEDAVTIYGVSTATVVKWRKALGLTFSTGRRCKSDKVKPLDFDNKQSIKEICLVHGVDMATAYEWKNNLC